MVDSLRDVKLTLLIVSFSLFVFEVLFIKKKLLHCGSIPLYSTGMGSSLSVLVPRPTIVYQLTKQQMIWLDVAILWLRMACHFTSIAIFVGMKKFAVPYHSISVRKNIIAFL